MSRFLALVVFVVAGCDAGARSPSPEVQPLPAPVKPPPVAPLPLAPPAPVPVATPVPVPVASHEHVLLASLERGVCYGTCPAYKLTVYRDGKVEYVGKNYVKKIGKAGGTLTDAQLAALDKLF